MKKDKQKKKFSLMRYVCKHWVVFTLYITCLALFYIGNTVSTVLLAKALAFITEYNYNMMLWYAGYASIAMVLGRCCLVVVDFSFARLVRDVSTEIRVDLTQRIFEISSKSFGQNSAGMFVNRIAYSPESAVESISDLVDVLGNIFASVVNVIYIMCLNIYVGLVIIVVLGLLMLLEYYKVKAYAKNKIKRNKTHDDIVSFSNEIVRSEKDIKSLNLEHKLKDASIETYDKYKNARYKWYTTDVKFWSTRHIILEIFAFGLILFSLYLLENGFIVLSSFLFIFSNRSDFASVIWSAGRVITKVADIRVENFRMGQLFDEDNFPVEKFGNVEIAKNDFKGKIEFKNVSFGYDDMDLELSEIANRDTFMNRKKYKEFLRKKNELMENKKNGVKNTTKKVIDSMNFEIPAGKTVAFVGRSGSGKSTILSLITKLYEVDEGAVLIDGIDVKELSKETLRDNISLVNQFPYIFNKSIRENMLLVNKNATEEMLEEALQKASLLDFVKGLKKGLDTVVGENGIKLSGGQKQRLAIARALLKESKIIIFDESTSSLDNFAQEDVRKSIESLTGETVIIVAHRLSTIRHADIIFFLDKGKIIDQGSFMDLFDNNEQFRNMFVAENIE